MKLEICVDTLASLDNAILHGADRIELCSALSLGGLSPSAGLLQMAKAHRKRVCVMVRPRAGDFCYSDSEFRLMLEELRLIRSMGFLGAVFGILLPKGQIDEARAKIFVQEAGQMELTFHRAFDNGANPHEMMESLLRLGIHRVLTSGQAQSAPEGAALIRELQDAYGKRIAIMPGSGVDDANLSSLIETTHCTEYHMSAKVLLPSVMQCIKPVMPIPHEAIWHNDGSRIRRARDILDRYESGLPTSDPTVAANGNTEREDRT